ncbi:MAG TPA: helix-turn-helix domain-containing protein [Candidatus Saccharimonadales bacterium]|nr:helix-turn-helix domain-containing protein [Candidatus Saccharimonadales bacterium]
MPKENVVLNFPLESVFTNRKKYSDIYQLFYKFVAEISEIDDPRVIRPPYEFVSEDSKPAIRGRFGNIVLSSMEDAILKKLSETPNELVSHANLIQAVKESKLLAGLDPFFYPYQLSGYVMQTRRKIHDYGQNPSIIVAIKGEGYKLNDPSHLQES